MLNAKVYCIEMNAPDDVSGLRELLDKGKLKVDEIAAILGKTEGNGCVNDYSRGFSTMAFKHFLAEYSKTSPQEVEKKVAFIMSGGTEGVMTPHATIFAQSEEEGEPGGLGLTLGVAFTRDFLPEEIGTVTMVEEVALSVENAMQAAKIDNVDHVHFVQIKCPLLTSARIEDAIRRGEKVVTTDTYESMGYSRAASALGVALALGEIDREALSDEVINKDWSLYSSVASTSAGVELVGCEIIVMGNSPHSVSKYQIGHSVMEDAIDLQGVLTALRNSGLAFDGLPNQADVARIVNVLAKAEADPTGFVRGRRTTMLTDSDINHTRHARAVVNGVIASVVGTPMIYVSGGAEHQGPAGGGPIAVIVEKG